MKRLLFVFFLLISLAANSQTWTTINNYQKIKGVWGNERLIVPLDTVGTQVGGLAVKNGIFYFRGLAKWELLAATANTDNLDSVLTRGNAAPNDTAKLGWLGLYDEANGEYGYVRNIDGNWELSNIASYGGYTVSLGTNLITSNRSFTIPDSTGTLALRAKVGDSIRSANSKGIIDLTGIAAGNLQQVTDNGAYTTNSFGVTDGSQTVIDLYNDGGDGTMSLYSGSDATTFNAGGFNFYLNSAGFSKVVQRGAITGSRTLTFPDTSGNFAVSIKVGDSIRMADSKGKINLTGLTGGSVTASNGLTASGGNVKQGGTLIEPTLIEGDGNTYEMSDLGSYNISTATGATFDLFNTVSMASPESVILSKTGASKIDIRDTLSLYGKTGIKLRDTSILNGFSSSGYVWTLINPTDGRGTWKPAGGGGSGVTSVGSGYGLSGGPITSTGTLTVDTTTLKSVYGSVYGTNIWSGPQVFTGTAVSRFGKLGIQGTSLGTAYFQYDDGSDVSDKILNFPTIASGDSVAYRSWVRSLVNANAYTFSTGLTNTAGTITNNLSTGVSGGQSVIGGTASGNNLTLSSTSNATKGNLLFGRSAYNEATNQLILGSPTTASDAFLTIEDTTTGSGIMVNKYTSTSTLAPGIFFSKASGTKTSPSQTGANHRILTILARGYNNAGSYNSNSIGIIGYTSQALTTANNGSYLTFELAATNTSTRAEVWRMSGSGSLSNTGAEGTAQIHLKAGTASASSAGIKQTSGTLNTTAEAGAMEYNGTFYDTKGSGLRLAQGGVIYDAYSDVNNSGTGETDIYSYTCPASTLANNGEKIQFKYSIRLTDVTATAQIRVYFGGTEIGNTGALTVSATGAVVVEGWVVRTGSSTARASVNISSPTASTAVYTAQTDLTGLTFTNTQIVKVTATAGGAGGGTGDIVGKMATVRWDGVAAN